MIRSTISAIPRTIFRRQDTHFRLSCATDQRTLWRGVADGVTAEVKWTDHPGRRRATTSRRLAATARQASLALGQCAAERMGLASASTVCLDIYG